MKQLLFGIFLWMLTGCHRQGINTPPNLIAEDKMIQILVDVHVADAVVEHKSGTGTANIPLTSALYTRIFKNYGVSDTQYNASYKYYLSQPNIMDRMYVQVITELSKKEALLNK